MCNLIYDVFLKLNTQTTPTDQVVTQIQLVRPFPRRQQEPDLSDIGRTSDGKKDYHSRKSNLHIVVGP